MEESPKLKMKDFDTSYFRNTEGFSGFQLHPTELFKPESKKLKEKKCDSARNIPDYLQ